MMAQPGRAIQEPRTVDSTRDASDPAPGGNLDTRQGRAPDYSGCGVYVEYLVMWLLNAIRGRVPRGRFHRLRAEDWSDLYHHALRLDSWEIFERFHAAMDSAALERWARAARSHDVFVWGVDGEIRGAVAIGYSGYRAECAVTVEGPYLSAKAVRHLVRLACRRARSKGANVMAMVTARGNRDLIDMAADDGWATSFGHARSIVLPAGEPAMPLWLLRDLTEEGGTAIPGVTAMRRFFLGPPTQEEN